MFIKKVTNFEELQPYQADWDRWASDLPFQCWTWVSTWWKHYGTDVRDTESNRAKRRLAVYLVFGGQKECNGNETPRSSCICREGPTPEGTLLGILPLYVESTSTLGTVLRFLGDGEVCSEYLRVLCEPQDVDRVTREFADYLVEHAHKWDLLKLETVCKSRTNLGRLVDNLEIRGCHLSERREDSCWTISLPDTWDEFLTTQSKSHRKQLRRLESRTLQSPEAQWHPVSRVNEFDQAWEYLIELHQLRRESLAEPGCFASPAWANFHREVSERLLAEGKLRLSYLTLNSKPVAAEYHLAGGRTIYAYQGGFDPECSDREPGRLSMIVCIQQAIAQGCDRFDLLRGDEPYKPHWRAAPQPTSSIEVVSPRLWALCRHQSWTGIKKVARAVKQVTSLLE